MPLRRFRSIRSSPQRRNASDMRPFNKRLDAKVGGGIPLARDEAKSLSRLTRLLQSLYPVNTGARRTCLPCQEDAQHARAERHAGVVGAHHAPRSGLHRGLERRELDLVERALVDVDVDPWR